MSVERSVHYTGQARNELPNTAGADHAYVPPLDLEEEGSQKRGETICLKKGVLRIQHLRLDKKYKRGFLSLKKKKNLVLFYNNGRSNIA